MAGKAYTGIELGMHSIKLAVCDGARVSKVMVERVPDGLMSDGRPTSLDALADFIKRVVAANGGASKNGVLVLPRSLAVTRRLTFPMMTVDEVKLNLPYEFRDYISDGKERFVYDYAVLATRADLPEREEPSPEVPEGMPAGGSFGARAAAQADSASGFAPVKPVAAPQPASAAKSGARDADRPAGTLELLATAARKEVIEDYAECLRRAGMRLVSAMPCTAALQNLMFYRGVDARADETCCIVSFGFASTDLYFFNGGLFDVVRSIDLGGRDINLALGEDLDMDEHLADSAKADFPDRLAASRRVQEVCERIAVEIGRAINFYGFNNPNTQLTALYGSGGEYLTTPLLDAVAGHTDIPLLDIETLYPSVDPAFAAAARLCPAAVGATLTVD